MTANIILIDRTRVAHLNQCVRAIREWQRGAIGLPECCRRCDLTREQWETVSGRLTRLTSEESIVRSLASALGM